MLRVRWAKEREVGGGGGSATSSSFLLLPTRRTTRPASTAATTPEGVDRRRGRPHRLIAASRTRQWRRRGGDVAPGEGVRWGCRRLRGERRFQCERRDGNGGRGGRRDHRQDRAGPPTSSFSLFFFPTTIPRTRKRWRRLQRRHWGGWMAVWPHGIGGDDPFCEG